MASMKDVQVKTGITALAGGANNASTPELVAGVNVIATTATAADSVRLPAKAAKGTIVVVRNNGGASANVFPPTGGAINGGSVDAAAAVATVKASLFVCVASTGLTWVTLAGA